MSQKLVDRSPDLKRLRDEGYDVRVVGTHLVVANIPYVTSARTIQRGALVCVLDLQQDRTTTPATHTVYFVGEVPCDKDGKPLDKIIHDSTRQLLAEGLEIQHMFSSKPNGSYPDFYLKMATYAKMLVHQAQAIDPSVTARIFPPIPTDGEDDTPFHYFDTASSRAGIEALSSKLRLDRIAIVGLGGTGGYVLDLVAKTHVREIYLFDDDDFCQHNAFRCPGALGIDDLKPMKKVEYYSALYGKLRKGIRPRTYRIDEQNVSELSSMNFVFLCLDSGEVKEVIMAELERAGVPFIDVGMGIERSDDALTGILRVTTSTPEKRDHVRDNGRVSFAPAVGENFYSRNIQVADLNALNATLAVIKWKKLFGFYHDLKREHHSTYVLETNKLSSEDRS
ncbi:ThiF family adenylyltransferase [Tahibacter amnicola]|uniref:ThiF family adenylyltransferase n=1 Tax=Tahibacter amnicola TaxID=2976241 RepID=A0ABY6B8X4_9GAMM|nr:ThiF family adenylyltransferase [Tahibacter amnicola]UXI66129.1 ThiF family adenylyltransferase [Tahibacter amnicola]